MRRCLTCHQLYSEDSFIFCLHDGTKLEDVPESDETLLLESAPSIVTFVSNRTEESNNKIGFEGKYIIEEISTDGLFLKILEENEDYVAIGFKITLKNLANEKKEAFVTVKGIDSDGFELEEYTISAKLNSGELKTVTSKQEVNLESFQKISEWKLDEIVSFN